MGRVGLAVRGLMGGRYILEGFEAVLGLGFTLWEMEDRRSLERQMITLEAVLRTDCKLKKIYKLIKKKRARRGEGKGKELVGHCCSNLSER